MKKKIYLLLALMLIGMKTLSEEKIIKNESDNKETEIEISLDNETVTSTNGIDVVYGSNRFKVFDIKRDTAANRMYINGDFTLDSYQPTGDIRIESKNAEALLDGSKAVFDTTFGYMQVGKVTGAEAPNDKIYFGGEKAKFDNGIVLLKNAWFTTDPKVNTNRDLTGLGYYIQSDRIKIEPDKQVTLTGSDLFIQDFDVMPFTFPWYRFNIRQGSEVPLFPMWGDETDYGWTISTGMLYESQDGKYRGGFAPKFGDRMGFLIGRMENWYDTGTYGESRLNITDLLVYKKSDKGINSETGRPDPSHEDRWDIDYSHKYDGEYGHFDFGVQSMTYNMNDTLKDIIEDYDAAGKFNHKDKNGNLVKGPLGEIPSMGDYSNFYTLDTSLTGLGERKDITIDAKVKLTDDKKAYQYIVNDQIDDLGYDSQVDNDLFSQVSVVKDNEDYKISGYYNYLYDMDPGSNVNDLQSRAEDFGFGFEDKNRKISFSYDEKNGDLYRRLNSWERNPDLSKLKTTDRYGLTADYVPWTVAMYDVYDSRNFGAVFGEYKLTDNISFKTGYNYTFSEKELNLENDPMRKNVFGEDSRWSQYNRFENITYEKIEEQRAFVDLYTGVMNFTFAGGTREETIHSREGLNSSFDYRVYKNESDFYEFGINKNNIGLGYLGEIDIFGNIRQDKFKNGINDTFGDTDNNDKTTRYQAGLNHRITLLDNSGNVNRFADVNLENEFKFFYEDYKYDGNSLQEYGRLINKENRYTYGDTVSFEFGNTETVYTGEYTLKERPENNKKSGEVLKNQIDFLVDGDKALSAYYNTDDRYSKEYNDTTSASSSDDRYNDLGYKDYGFNLYTGNHEFYYKNQSIDFTDFNYKPFGFITKQGLSEEIREHVFGYTYTFGEDKLNFEYTQGTDKATVGNIDVLDIDNRTYAVTYINGGEIEHSYSVKYEDYQGNYKKLSSNGSFSDNFMTNYNSNVITLRYGFKDKRLSDSELERYAQREYGKDRGELTAQDVNNIRSVLENRNSASFNLSSVMNNKIYFGDYRRSFDARLTLESNDDRRHEENYWDSLSKIEATVFYSQNRVGLGYTFTQEADYSGKDWNITEREHEFSFHAKIGKPSEGWRLKTYIQFYDNIDGNYGDGTGRRFFDEAGVEIGKEMGYYEWSVAYMREYSISTRDYEWKAALQFTLLTFPDKRLFGIGAKGDSQPNSSVKPDVHVFSGIKIEDSVGQD